MTRNTLFLYPNLNEFKEEEQNTILKLISDLKFIINDSNEKIERILRNGSFAYIRCLPTVEMEGITYVDLEDDSVSELVRICIIEFEGNNYESDYKTICEKYTNNSLGISHLVGLKINLSLKEVNFIKPDNSPFDVVIETGLNNLKAIIISIMLDISIYHYFLLSNVIDYRKKFSNIKMQGIKNSDLKDEYGKNVDFDKIKYLPFTYPYIKNLLSLDSNINESTSKDKIENLIENYFDFIKNYVCNTIMYNRLKESNMPYDEIKYKYIEDLEKVVSLPQIELGKQYFILIKNGISNTSCIEIDNKNVFVIEDNETSLTEWLSIIQNPLDNFSLYYIKIGA